MKKLAAIILIVLAFQSAVPRRSEAIAGVTLAMAGMDAAIGIGVLGGVLTVGGAAGSLEGLFYGKPAFIAGLIALIAGLVLLDEHSTAPVQFAVIDSRKAIELGMTPEEQIAYNSQLDEINAIQQTVTLELSQVPGAAPRDAHDLWQRYRGYIDADAFSALEKVSDALVRATLPDIARHAQ